ncbi:hypothetical protein CP973_04765 [Streptomyces albofaciens JCM 4342]|uniref:hypothetical protein n=1 Tax=Streptomyces albofaciens TaxID=66866 RepID=UPI00123A732C|nr:hypothetical protein [Streptomyces albofaciens]KAA6221373.1 hypothetical protein CP973_04765 [Streptomyces albofaciens JCM 4342]
MTISPRTYEGAMECQGCLELARALVAALKAGDQSKATDCQVLIRRHPDHPALPPGHGPDPRFGPTATPDGERVQLDEGETGRGDIR